MFANYFALIIQALKEVKNSSKSGLDTTPTVTNITPINVKDEVLNKDIDISESSQFNGSESPLQKDSVDDTSSIYAQSKYTVSSAEPTPEQKAIKKSPVKGVQKIGKTPQKPYFVKKGYQSSENNSTGSHRRAKKYEENKMSPAQRTYNVKKNPSAAKKSITLKINKSGSKSKLSPSSSRSKLKNKLAKSKANKLLLNDKNDTSEGYGTNRTNESPNLKSGRNARKYSETLDQRNITLTDVELHDSRAIPNNLTTPELNPQVAKEKSHYSETTEESEDQHPQQSGSRLKVYDKKVHGGLLYAFLDLNACPKPQPKDDKHIPLQKSVTYNAEDINVETYKKSVADYAISGLSRHQSSKVNSGSLSDEDYKRINELKNERKSVA